MQYYCVLSWFMWISWILKGLEWYVFPKQLNIGNILCAISDGKLILAAQFNGADIQTFHLK